MSGRNLPWHTGNIKKELGRWISIKWKDSFLNGSLVRRVLHGTKEA